MDCRQPNENTGTIAGPTGTKAWVSEIAILTSITKFNHSMIRYVFYFTNESPRIKHSWYKTSSVHHRSPYACYSLLVCTRRIQNWECWDTMTVADQCHWYAENTTAETLLTTTLIWCSVVDAYYHYYRVIAFRNTFSEGIRSTGRDHFVIVYHFLKLHHDNLVTLWHCTTFVLKIRENIGG